MSGELFTEVNNHLTWKNIKHLQTTKWMSLKDEICVGKSRQEHHMQVPTLDCDHEVLDKMFKSNEGHNSEKKKAFRLVSLDSMDCFLDSDHILWVSSKYLQ